MNYYNEIDPFAANWLRELIKARLIPDGHVDERSIKDVKGKDLEGYTQCHFFAGIGGWSRALELSGWSADRPVWTGSCPCQSLSVAGLGKGAKDDRHLWPEFARLICECRPATVFGEQVASKLGREWLSGVRLDLEAMGYAVGAADLPAACVGAPHIRQRLWWVADSGKPGLEGWGEPRATRTKAGRGFRESGSSFWSNSTWWPCRDGKWRRVPGRLDVTKSQRLQVTWQEPGRSPETPGGSGWICDTASTRYKPEGKEPEKEAWDETWVRGFKRGQREIQNAGHDRLEIEPGVLSLLSNGISDGLGDVWDECEKEKIIEALNGFPLAEWTPNRVGMLRGAGNAIVPQLAAVFIKSFMEVTQ